jgi:hypothetical protein
MNNVLWFAPNSRKPRFSAVCHQSERRISGAECGLYL